MKTKANKNQKYDFIKRLDEKYLNVLNACNENINSLVKEAKLLFNFGYFARSFLLSYSALEELGKRLIVADYITGIVAQKEFENSFYNHNIKIAYLHNNVNLAKLEDGTLDATLVYVLNKYKPYLDKRNKSIYVDFKNNEAINPIETITKKDSEMIYDYVLKMIKHINYCEELNGRLGSKAIYK